MTLFLPFLLAGPVLMLATAVVALWAHGPLGWLASLGLLAGVAWSMRAGCRLCLRWWRSTKAPVREPTPARSAPGR